MWDYISSQKYEDWRLYSLDKLCSKQSFRILCGKKYDTAVVAVVTNIRYALHPSDCLANSYLSFSTVHESKPYDANTECCLIFTLNLLTLNLLLWPVHCGVYWGAAKHSALLTHCPKETEKLWKFFQRGDFDF